MILYVLILQVAKVFLLLLNKMSESYDLTKIHVIGHSLGAQVAARLGEKLKAKNITLSRITGLDPAGKKSFECLRRLF